MALARAKNPFQFVTKVNLIELTGLRAKTLPELVQILRNAPSAVVYQHTHHFLKQHQALSPEPPNDFAYWVTAVLNDDALGEQLAAIDTVQFSSLRVLRDHIVQVIEKHLAKGKPVVTAPDDEAFDFMKSLSFVLPTPYQATDLREFIDAIQKISVHSLYHHIFESRLRLEKGTNDLTAWLDKELGESALGAAIARLDPYTQTMESLRSQIVRLAEARLQQITIQEPIHA
jgi:hypothetical protein